MTHVDENAVWRAPDGTHYEILTVTTGGLYHLQRVHQDPDTRQWSIDGIQIIDVQEDALLREYIAVEREPLPEPRIVRLSGLIHELLASHEEATGHPSPVADEILSALAEVEAIPAEAKRRRR